MGPSGSTTTRAPTRSRARKLWNPLRLRSLPSKEEARMSQQVAGTGQAADAAWVEEFAQRWLDAWNSHEQDRLLGLMTEDIVYDDSAWPTQMRGHSDVREFLDHTWRALPDLRFE